MIACTKRSDLFRDEHITLHVQQRTIYRHHNAYNLLLLSCSLVTIFGIKVLERIVQAYGLMVFPA